MLLSNRTTVSMMKTSCSGKTTVKFDSTHPARHLQEQEELCSYSFRSKNYMIFAPKTTTVCKSVLCRRLKIWEEAKWSRVTPTFATKATTTKGLGWVSSFRQIVGLQFRDSFLRLRPRYPPLQHNSHLLLLSLWEGRSALLPHGRLPLRRKRHFCCALADLLFLRDKSSPVQNMKGRQHITTFQSTLRNFASKWNKLTPAVGYISLWACAPPSLSFLFRR